MESKTPIELLFCVRIDILDSEDIILFSEMFEEITLNFSDQTSFIHERALKNYVFFNCVIDQKQLSNSIYLKMRFKDETSIKLGVKEKILTFKSKKEDLVFNEIKTASLKFSIQVFDPKNFPKLKTLKYLNVDDIIDNYGKKTKEKKIELEISAGKEIGFDKSKTNENSKKKKKKKKNKKKEEIATISQNKDEVEKTNDDPELNQQIPPNKNEETSPSNIETTDLSTGMDLRKNSKENYQSIQQNLFEINQPENYQKNNQENAEEFINQHELKSFEKSENNKNMFEEIIKQLKKEMTEEFDKKMTAKSGEIEGLKKEMKEMKEKAEEFDKKMNDMKTSYDLKFKLILNNLSYLNKLCSAWYLRYLNEKLVNSFFSKTKFKSIESKLYFGMNDKISTMFEIIKMIKSKSMELNVNNIKILIEEWELPNFICIKTDEWAIPIEKREAYYISKIKTHYKNPEKIKEFFNQEKLTNFEKFINKFDEDKLNVIREFLLNNHKKSNLCLHDTNKNQIIQSIPTSISNNMKNLIIYMEELNTDEIHVIETIDFYFNDQYDVKLV
jgi:hypothetical protein